jgi:hypothetical protein
MKRSRKAKGTAAPDKRVWQRALWTAEDLGFVVAKFSHSERDLARHANELSAIIRGAADFAFEKRHRRAERAYKRKIQGVLRRVGAAPKKG